MYAHYWGYMDIIPINKINNKYILKQRKPFVFFMQEYGYPRSLSVCFNHLSVLALLITGVLKWCLRANRCSSLFLSQLGRLLPPISECFPCRAHSIRTAHTTSETDWKSHPLTLASWVFSLSAHKTATASVLTKWITS